MNEIRNLQRFLFLLHSRDEIGDDDNPISLLRALERKQMREADALKLIDAQVSSVSEPI